MSNFMKNLWSRIQMLFRGEEFLCDNCMYDYGNACNREERPNATSCPDYKRK